MMRTSCIVLQFKTFMYMCFLFGGKTHLIELHSPRIAEYLISNSNTTRYPLLFQLYPVISGMYTAISDKILVISPAEKHNPYSTKIPPHFFYFWLTKTENIIIVPKQTSFVYSDTFIISSFPIQTCIRLLKIVTIRIRT